MPDDYYMTRPQVAALFQISERTVDRWRLKYGLPYIKEPSSHAVRFVRYKVIDWFERFSHGDVKPAYPSDIPRTQTMQSRLLGRAARRALEAEGGYAERSSS